ncbi:hypothetical protein [Sedimentisphaera salicampi]|uniref:hypothetical protein n=1 Tax=Sedimentisphaera salicampi TaxID=1941349 RepID=UPI000B9C5F24|nr:hypothetical protein [Sedimentisphaera salicampi]
MENFLPQIFFGKMQIITLQCFAESIAIYITDQVRLRRKTRKGFFVARGKWQSCKSACGGLRVAISLVKN